ncbi:hypothetical protein LIER_15616 [Lithospermum erythrorhizon]|uniref:Gag-pol polyprotein n=1 Tax=Lithospermum erythrorhizon TaxID=34254 RepID=A0AAV3Q3Z4_LITER
MRRFGVSRSMRGIRRNSSNIGTLLGEEHEAMLIQVLREYRDIFAWEPKDMPGVDPKVSVHQLYVDPHYKPITFSEEKGKAIREEVDKQLGAKAIHELLFPIWLANVVLVPKPNRTWRMCTDFTSINKASPKDYYHTPNIDRLVYSSIGYKVADFLDVFRGCHQIFMV